MAFETPSYGDSEWDLWRKAVNNQVIQTSRIGQSAQMKSPSQGDSVIDLQKKFTHNQFEQG